MEYYYSITDKNLELDAFKMQMLNNVSLSNVIGPINYKVSQGLSFKVNLPVETITLSRQLSNKDFNMTLFTQLLADYKTALMACEDFLFESNHLIYHLDLVFYDLKSGHFQFIMVPLKRDFPKFHGEATVFFETVLIECFMLDLLEKSVFLDLLKSFHQGEYHVLHQQEHPLNKSQKKFKGGKYFRYFSFQNNFFNQFKKHVLSPKKQKPLTLDTSKTAMLKKQPKLINCSNPEIFYAIYYQYTKIGRSEKSTFRIEDATVSQEQAEIRFIDNQYFISDCNSLNGTFLNNEKLMNESYLRNGDKIRFGDLEFVFIS